MLKRKKADSVSDILRKGTQSIGEADNALAQFVRSIIITTNITPRKLNEYVNVWVKKNYPGNEKLQSSAKSNILRMLTSGEVTFKTMLRFFDIMRFKEVSLILMVRDDRGQRTYHQQTIFGRKNVDDEADELDLPEGINNSNNVD